MFAPWPVTIVVLTKNEAPRMKRCLSSFIRAERVLLMDSMSDDGTLECARKVWEELQAPADALTLVQVEWKGFVQTRNESLRWVCTPWVLWIDADEWLEDSLRDELEKFFEEQKDQKDVRAVWEIPRLTEFLGRKIYHGGWWPDRKRRLARTEACEWVAGPAGALVHETLVPRAEYSPSIGRFRHALRHETFRNVAELEETNERYSTLLAEALAKKYLQSGRSAPSRMGMFVKFGIKWIENYIWKRGFLDGYPGWVIARGSARSLYLRLQKTRILMGR